MPQANPQIQNAISFAIVVFANWLLAHLATDWVMPSEVAQAAQTLVHFGLSALAGWLLKRGIRLAQNGNGAAPAVPPTQAKGSSI